MAVEERTLFRENQAGVAVAHERELHRGQRDGDPRLLQAHLVGVDDALGRDDVVEERLIAVGAAIRRGARLCSRPPTRKSSSRCASEPTNQRALAFGSAQAANARSGDASYLRSTTKVACSTDRPLIACSLSVRRCLRRGTRQDRRGGAPSSTAVRRSIARRAAAPPARSGRSAPVQPSRSGRGRSPAAPAGAGPPPTATSAAGSPVR